MSENTAMMALIAFDVFEVYDDGEVFSVPMGLYDNIEVAKLSCELHYPSDELAWEKVMDHDNMRMVWEGYNGAGVLLVRIVPVPMNSKFAGEGKILGIQDR